MHFFFYNTITQHSDSAYNDFIKPLLFTLALRWGFPLINPVAVIKWCVLHFWQQGQWFVWRSCVVSMSIAERDKAKRHHPEAHWLYGLTGAFPMGLSSSGASNESGITTIEHVKKVLCCQVCCRLVSSSPFVCVCVCTMSVQLSLNP